MTEAAGRVLVVDDDLTNLELVERRLEVEGFATVLVETGQEGINRALGEPYDAVLLDLRLPDMNGLEVLERVQQERPDLPVLIMTAHGSEAIAVKALTAGAASYLIKPISRKDLVAALKSAIEQSQRRRESEAARGTLQTAVAALEQDIAEEERERERLEDLLDALEEGVLLLGADGHLEAINRAGQDLLRLRMPVTSLHDLVRDMAEVRDEHDQRVDLVNFEPIGPMRDAEYQVRWDDGTERAFSVSIKAFPVDQPTSRWVILFRDVTERRARRLRLEALLAEQASELAQIQALRESEVQMAAESVERVKSSIITTLSHELRTPLNFIVGFGSVLADGVAGSLTVEQLALVQKMLHGAERLIGVVEDLLDYAMLDAGMLEAILEPVDVAVIAREAVDAAAPVAAEAGLTLRVEAEGPALAWADAGFVRKVVRQLVGNALKFTQPGGEVAVRVEVNGQATVIVADTGIGVAPEELPRLFDRFYQVESQATRRFGGTGMGLALAKSLAETMGASLDAESRAGSGSTFRLVLPKPSA